MIENAKVAIEEMERAQAELEAQLAGPDDFEIQEAPEEPVAQPAAGQETENTEEQAEGEMKVKEEGR